MSPQRAREKQIPQIMTATTDLAALAQEIGGGQK